MLILLLSEINRLQRLRSKNKAPDVVLLRSPAEDVHTSSHRAVIKGWAWSCRVVPFHFSPPGVFDCNVHTHCFTDATCWVKGEAAEQTCSSWRWEKMQWLIQKSAEFLPLVTKSYDMCFLLCPFNKCLKSEEQKDLRKLCLAPAQQTGFSGRLSYRHWDTADTGRTPPWGEVWCSRYAEHTGNAKLCLWFTV